GVSRVGKVRVPRLRVGRALVAVLALAVGATVAPGRSTLAADKKEAPADQIVISGASGGLAGETLSELLARGVPFKRLILVTRTPEKLASFVERGAQVRLGDFTKPETLAIAWRSTRRRSTPRAARASSTSSTPRGSTRPRTIRPPWPAIITSQKKR